MITVLAEKPSVARELARLLGAPDRKDGYFEGNGYLVTWAIGHLVGLAPPQDYGITGFQAHTLPILPDPFMLTPRQSGGKGAGKPDKGAGRQLEVISKLFDKCDSIIVATDAGREGELIFRYIYEYTGCKKPFDRLWVSSLTEKALKDGFANLLPGSDFDGMYLAARARSRADWLVGLNASRALAMAAGSGVYSLGRVQTPTLGMICQRFEQHQNFTKEKFWQLQLQHTKSFVAFKSNSVLTWNIKEKAEEALRSVQRAASAEVVSVTNKTVTDKPPLLFDLTGLQKHANTKFGFSAAETLEIAQALYEKQFITYPRTGSKYITQDLWPAIPGLIRGLEFAEGFAAILPKVKLGKLNKHIVNDGKVADHHGLLITEKIPSALSVREMTLYRLIALRLLEAVSEACVRDTTGITLQVLHYEFTTSSGTVLEPGWRGIQSDFAEADAPMDSLPELHQGEEVKIVKAALEEKQRQPPLLYTEATLLAAMETAGTSLEDQALKDAIKGSGLGTPATRAGIIEALLERDYIERKGKVLLPTVKGVAVFTLVADKDIASVAMTAGWEAALEKIEAGTFSSEAFQVAIEAYTHKITTELLNAKVVSENVPLLLCPRCKSHNLLINEKIIKCPDQSCGWEQYRNLCGILLPVDEIANLIRTGQTSLIKGMKSKSGKPFTARLVLNNESQVQFAFK